MENITRTVTAAYLQSCSLTGVAWTMKPYTTLNEKFTTQAGVAPGLGVLPKLRYYTVGAGGHQMAVDSEGFTYPRAIQHRATDFALYGHRPLVLRPIANDLPPELRALYGMRVIQTHNSAQYVAYYLRRIDFTSVIATMLLTSVNAGVKTTAAFVPSNANLNPTPPLLDSSGVVITTGDYTEASVALTIPFSAWEVNEYKAAALIVYGNENYAIISEVGLVAGVDKDVQAAAVNSGTITFNEVIAAQVLAHVNVFYPLNYAANGIELALDVGATDPLFSLA